MNTLTIFLVLKNKGPSDLVGRGKSILVSLVSILCLVYILRKRGDITLDIYKPKQ